MMKQEPSVLTNAQAFQKETLDWINRYFTRVNFNLIDERRCIPPGIILDLGRNQLYSLECNEKISANRNNIIFNILHKLGQIDLSISAFLAIQNALCIFPIHKFASQTIQQQYLDELANGHMLAAYALTEPEAGSNPLGIQTTIEELPNGDYVINGQKCWIGNGSWSTVMLVVGRHLQNGRFLGYSIVLVPTESDGVHFESEAMTLGVKGLVQSNITFTNVNIPHDNIIGNKGAGMSIASQTMNRGRFYIAAMATGGHKCALDMLTKYALNRKIGPDVLYNNPHFIAQYNRIRAWQSILNNIVTRTALFLDQNIQIPNWLFAILKIVCSEVLSKTVDYSMQYLGGRGYLENNKISRLYRDSRVCRIFEGPTETLVHYVGNSILEAPNVLFDFLRRNDLKSHLIDTENKINAYKNAPSALNTYVIGHWIAYYLCKVLLINNDNNEADVIDEKLNSLELEFQLLNKISIKREPLAVSSIIEQGAIENWAMDNLLR